MTKLIYELDPPIGHRATLGLVVLQTDESVEYEFRQMLPSEGVSLYVTRIPSKPDVTPESLATMEAEIPASVGLLPPSLSFDAVGYACTSGATVIGPERIASLVKQATRVRCVTDPISSVIAACRALNVRRLGFLTPYVPSVSEAMRNLLEDSGFEIAAFGSFEELEEARIARIAPRSILSAISEIAGMAKCDAVFASCTNLRALGIIDAAESATGIPVISSNLALGWNLLRSVGVSIESGPFGRLSAIS